MRRVVEHISNLEMSVPSRQRQSSFPVFILRIDLSFAIEKLRTTSIYPPLPAQVKAVSLFLFLASI